MEFGTCHLQYYLQMDIRSKNKAADCLSRLIPPTGNSINMLTASKTDGPAFHTRSHTQSALDSASTPQVMPQPHISQDNDPTPKSITDDCQEALLLMQCTDPFSKRLLNGRAPHHDLTLSPTLRDYSTNMCQMLESSFLP